ncbi:hypothetical protein HYW82_00535 [Candidatus Peregrinibacteria bacterium]|nr:hypothetical protein [Candidatus Peregrinibacteria bacterium]
MDIRLSWDLFVLVFFIVIVAYSFIIGRDNTLKVILGTYVAALAADATGNLFGSYFGGSGFLKEILKFAALGNEDEAVIILKVLVFVALVILFAVRGAFAVQTGNGSGFGKIILSVLYAVMSAGLIISVILVFVSGVSFVGGGSPETTGVALWDIYNNSKIVKSIVANSYWWFAIPALAFLIQSFRANRGEE